jgi:hypothetical protein
VGCVHLWKNNSEKLERCEREEHTGKEKVRNDRCQKTSIGSVKHLLWQNISLTENIHFSTHMSSILNTCHHCQTRNLSTNEHELLLTCSNTCMAAFRNVNPNNWGGIQSVVQRSKSKPSSNSCVHDSSTAASSSSSSSSWVCSALLPCALVLLRPPPPPPSSASSSSVVVTCSCEGGDSEVC